ncbi:MAG: DUF1700 domain-containing protein [Clostridiales bacterium]|jgi:uncharacterized membrane protein|nr:DUF1700 domain-containing protein [Clostridiales bacterium]
MDKEQWFLKLENHLQCLKQKERQDLLQHYTESFNDRLESGQDEQQIIKELGDPESIVDKYKNERIDWAGINSIFVQAHRQQPVLFVILFLFASPILISLLLVFFSVIFTVVMAVVCVSFTLIILFFVIDISGFAFVFGGFVSIVFSIITMTESVGAGFALLGASIVLIGIGVILIVACKTTIPFSIKFAKMSVVRIENLIIFIKNKFINLFYGSKMKGAKKNENI